MDEQPRISLATETASVRNRWLFRLKFHRQNTVANIIYPSSAAYDGPWLIEFARLVELDSIVDDIWKKMVEHRENRIQEELARTLSEKPTYADIKEEIEKDLRKGWRLGREERKLNVHLDSGKQVVGESFQEIAKERLAQNEVCTAFQLSLHCADVTSEITLNRFDDLQYSVEPSTLSVTKDTTYLFESWIASVRSPRWVMIWKEWGSFLWLPLLLVVVLSLPLLGGFPVDRYKNELKFQAYELLKDGITPDETQKALDILLKLQSGFLPNDYIERNPISLRGWYILVMCAALVGIIGLVPPKTNLGAV